jgi:hypothetical protein
VIEIHGKYDALAEFSTNAYPSVKKIILLQNNKDCSIAEVLVDNKKLLIAQCNKDFDNKTKHTTQNISWTGPYAVWYDGKILN